MHRLKKLLIYLFIFFSLFVQLHENFNISLPTPTEFASNLEADEYWKASIYYRVTYSEWFLKRIAWFLALTTKWRMFSPPDKQNWRFVFTLKYQDGTEEVLPLAWQTERSFWQRTLFDFREVKFHLNIYNSKQGQYFYAQHLCHHYWDPKRGDAEIEILFRARRLLSPEEAAAQGVWLDPNGDKRIWNSIECEQI